MENNVYTIYETEREFKRRQRKEWVIDKVNKVIEFADEHKDILAVVVPSALGLGTAGIKAISKHKAQNKERDIKDRYCYDNRLGHYWVLRRELTNSEWLEIDRRKRNGEMLADILDEMRVLK